METEAFWNTLPLGVEELIAPAIVHFVGSHMESSPVNTLERPKGPPLTIPEFIFCCFGLFFAGFTFPDMCNSLWHLGSN